MKAGAAAAFVVLLGLSVAGCAVVVPADYDPRSSAHIERPIPLRVGLNLSGSFRRYMVQAGGSSAAVGDALVTGGERMARRAFAGVETIDTAAGQPTRADIKVILTPEIVSMSIGGGATVSCEVRSRWTAVTTSGSILYTGSIVGTAEATIFDRFVAWKRSSECLRRMVHDLYDKVYMWLFAAPWWEGFDRSGG